MEKLPLGERPEPRVVGPATERKKKKFAREIVSRFGEAHYERLSEEQRRILETSEYDKRPAEKFAAEKANEITNRLLTEAGVQPFDVPERNVHLLPAEAYGKFEGKRIRDAVTIADKQIIFIKSEIVRKSPVIASTIILHEIAHLKEHFAAELTKKGSHGPHREGVGAMTTFKKAEAGGYARHFTGLDEAVVAEVEKEYFNELIGSNPHLKKEKKRLLSQKFAKIKVRIAKEKGIESDEIFWVDKSGKDHERFPYYRQRKVLHFVVDCIVQDSGKPKEDTMKLFIATHFNGQLLPVARAVEESFGEGSFRVLGMMDDNPESAVRVMEYLTKRRRLMKQKVRDEDKN